MSGAGKMLVLLGVVLVVVGLAVWSLGRLGFRGLPGDIRYESQGVRFYFPIVTCIAASVLLSAALWLWQWLSRR